MSTEYVLSLLDENDLTSPRAIEKFLFNRTIRDIRSLREAIRTDVDNMGEECRLQMPSDPLGSANFFPSGCLRGEFGCSAWGCRLGKVQTMARYASLYCDRLLFPLLLDPTNRRPSHFDERYSLGTAILSLHILRPLLERGIVTLIPHHLHFCEQHLKEAVPEFAEVRLTAKAMGRALAPKFSITYYAPDKKGRGPALQYEGPEDYIEHGSLTYRLRDLPLWLPKTWRGLGSKEKKELSQALVKRADVLAPVFHTIANDFVLQQYFGVAYNARYVTDLPGEAEFFAEISKNDSLAMQTAALCARLTHTIPLMRDIPLETVLNVRDAEPEAFLNYRATITSIVKNHVRSGRPVSDAEAKEIYTDELLPKLQRLEATAHEQRRSKVKRAAAKVVASSAILALGIYGGLLPATGTQLATALGGLAVAKDIAEAIGAIEKNPTEIRNHNLFFLLRLKQAKK